MDPTAIPPPKKAVLRIFIALKNPSLSVGFGPANLCSNGEHANNYTTEDDFTSYFRVPLLNYTDSKQNIVLR
jgi:hypothetical protein